MLELCWTKTREIYNPYFERLEKALIHESLVQKNKWNC